MALGNLCQEHRHRLGIHPGQHEAVHHAVVRADGTEGIDVLPLQARADHRARGSGRPAAPRRAQEPEPTLVLEHQPHRAALLSLAHDLFAYLAAEFF